VLARCIYSIFKVTKDGKRMSLEQGIYEMVFLPWLSPINASLAFAVTFVLFFYAILYYMYKRNIIFKV